MRNLYLKLIVIFNLMFFASSLYANQADTLKKLIETKVGTIQVILLDTNLTKNDKEVKIIKSIEDIFDFKLMSKLSLGSKSWKKLTKEEKKQYSDLFVKKIQVSYFEKLESYSNEPIEVTGSKVVKKRIYVKSNIATKGEPVEVTYKFYKSKNGDWLIYDLDIAGVSLVKSYRSQFNEILTKSSFEELIKKLQAQE